VTICIDKHNRPLTLGYLVSSWGPSLLLALIVGLWAGTISAQSAGVEVIDIKSVEATLWAKPDADDIRVAQETLEKLAVANDTEAQHVLGRHLLNGWVLEQDKDQGLKWLEVSAQAGNTAAQTELGQIYLWGIQVPSDADRAQSFLETAVENGDRAAMRTLGEELILGGTLPRDTVRGRALLEQTIAAGDIQADVVLGKLLLYGLGLEQDREKALELFEEAAEAGNGHGLAAYGDELMWRFNNPVRAEEILNRAGELGASEAWVSLANGAMYGYLGGGKVSRAKFAGYAEKARDAGEEEIAVLEAERNMWGINMRASGPETLDRLRSDAEAGNAAAAGLLIELLRDGNKLNIRKRPEEARTVLAEFGDLLSEKMQAQYDLTIDAVQARTPQAYAPVAAAFNAQPDLMSNWFGQQIVKANPNVAIYILQQKFSSGGTYAGQLDGLATRATLRAVYKACLTLDKPERCDDTVMRPDVLGALLVRR